MEYIHTDYSQTAQGHYTPAVVHQGIAYISGQLPIDYAAGRTAPYGSVEEQARLALRNLENVLALCGSGKEQVLKTTVYIPDMAYWPTVNRIYGEFFGGHKPARTIVPTAELHFGALIEVEAVAALRRDSRKRPVGEGGL